jgi:restriction endonuclease S subunit
MNGDILSEADELLPAPGGDEIEAKYQGAIQSIDELIQLQTEKLELLKRHKRGLLQRLATHKAQRKS